MNISIVYTQRYSRAFYFLAWKIKQQHYLHSMPSERTSYEIFSIYLNTSPVGALVFGRPQATKCGNWYGDVKEVNSGRCEVTRWQVLNLARVWIDPAYQRGGQFHSPDHLPGFVDRFGVFRSTLASDALKATMQVIGFEYLLYRLPVFLDEPYQIDWLLSYCNTQLHKGTIYREAGFSLYSTNDEGKQTWRLKLPPLDSGQHETIKMLSMQSQRAKTYRAARSNRYEQVFLENLGKE